ncbi:hypothetical protein [Mesorhizobium sp.]|uniref:hypothetical protein n=1 Tax=Mesorhizobium sp. TaxID=1871066 RepID=UPI00345CC485
MHVIELYFAGSTVLLIDEQPATRNSAIVKAGGKPVVEFKFISHPARRFIDPIISIELPRADGHFVKICAREGPVNELSLSGQCRPFSHGQTEKPAGLAPGRAFSL